MKIAELFERCANLGAGSHWEVRDLEDEYMHDGDYTSVYANFDWGYRVVDFLIVDDRNVVIWVKEKE